MSLAVCHSQCAATAASSQRAAAPSSIRAPLRCFTAAVRGQQLVQQRAAVRAQRAAVLARATFAAEEEPEAEEVRPAGLQMRRLWQRGGPAGGAVGAAAAGTARGSAHACPCPSFAAPRRRTSSRSVWCRSAV